MPKKVLIIGAGISGISAGRHLVDNSNLDVTLLEANYDRIGGRMRTYYPFENPDKPVELGAMWLHEGSDPHHPLTALCRKYGLETKICAYGSSMSIYPCDPALKFESKASDFDEHFAEYEEALKDIGRYYRENPNLPDKPILDALQEKSPEWRKKLQEPFNKHIAVKLLDGVEGSTLNTISTRFYNWKPVTDSPSLHGPDLIVTSGYRKLLEGMISDGKRLEIKLGQAVSAIRCLKEKVEVETTTGEIYWTDFVIVTVPLGILKANRISFYPELPLDFRKAVERIGYGNYVKLLLIFEKPFWPMDADWFETPGKWPLSFLGGYINMQRVIGLPALLGYSTGDGAYYADTLTDLEFVDAALDQLRIAFKTPSLPILKHAVRTKWTADPLSLGAYSYKKLGMQEEDAFNIRKPIADRLFFAGEHTVMPEDLNGYTHGAYLSGIRAANEVLRTSIGKSSHI